MEKTKQKILIPAIALSSIAFISITVLIILMIKNLVINEAEQLTSAKADNLVTFIDSTLNQYKSELELLATTDTVRSLEKKRIIKYLKENKALSDDFIMTFIGDSSGNYSTTQEQHHSMLDRPYFHEAMKGKSVISEPILGKTVKKYLIVIAVPVKDHRGKITGIIAGTVLLSKLSDKINSEKLGETGYAFMLDQYGIVIAHNREEFLFVKNLLKDENRSLSELAIKMIHGDRGSAFYNFEGTKKICSYAPIKNTGWSLAVTVPVNELYNKMKPIASVALILIMISTLIILVIGRLIYQSFKEARLTEEKIEEKRFLKNLISTIPGMVYRFRNNKKFSMEYVSDGCIDVTGYTIDEIIQGKIAYLDLVPEEEMEAVKNRIAESAEKNQPYEIMHRFNSPDGTTRWIYNSGTAVLSGEGKALFFEGVAMNMTAQKQREQILQHIQKMESIGNLASGLAHDFNNILTGISGAASLLLYHLGDTKKEDKDTEKKLFIIKDSAARAAGVVKQLLSLSRKQELVFKTVDLNNSLHNVFDLCYSTFDKSIDLNINYFEGRAFVAGDPGQIEQVILNICINAMHAMTTMREDPSMSGGRLTVNIETVSPDDYFLQLNPEASSLCDYYVLKIQDTGIGMSAETINQIFDPFFTLKKEQNGTGLGLAMVYNIVHQHNGFVKVYSEIGAGTVFSIFFPQLSAELAPDNETEEHNIFKGSGTILIVDDEKSICSVTKMMLEDCGYAVIDSSDSTIALDIYRNKYQIIMGVFIDISMPNMSGTELLSEMKTINPDIKAIVMTGLLDNKRVSDMLKIGAKGFIIKPFTLYSISKIARETFNTSEEE